MKYLMTFNESNEDELQQAILELNGEINIEEMEICFIDLMDDGIIRKLSMTPIVDRWQKCYSLTIYINIHFNKSLNLNEPEEEIAKYINYKLSRFKELFDKFFPNYKITDFGAVDSYDIITRRCDTIKVISTIPLQR